MAVFNIIHISDLHFGVPVPEIKGAFERTRSRFFKGLAPHQPGLLTALQKGINSVKDEMKSVDLIIISGDIATTGNDGDLQVAISNISEFKSFNLLVLPGNHDRFFGTQLKPGGTEFDFYFYEMWPAGEILHHKIIKKHNETIAIICADLTFRVPHPENPGIMLGKWGQGIVYSEAISALKIRIDNIKYENGDIEIILAIHFAPHSPPSYLVKEDERLSNEDIFLKAAENLGIKYLFCGHIHKADCYTKNNLSVCVAGTPTQQQEKGTGNEFSLYRLNVINNKVNTFENPFIYKWNDIEGFIFDRLLNMEAS